MVSGLRSLTAVRRVVGWPILLVGFVSLLGVVMAASQGDGDETFPQMLELSTRPWLYLLSQKYGRNLTSFSSIPDAEFAAIRKQGYKVVWMMGVWALGPYGLHFDRTNPGLLQGYAQTLPDYTVADIIGSPYAPVEYVTNPQLGSDDDLRALRQKLNSMGLKLMLDFVPNHSAVDAPWTSEHPEYYIHAPKGTNPPYDSTRYLPNGIAYGWAGWGGGWMDTAQYNYWNPDFVNAQVLNVLKIASLADYIRCDMAYLNLNSVISQNWNQNLASWGYSAPQQDFWAVAIPAAKAKFPNVKFLAEVYYPWQSQLQQWFDFTYDKQLYDRLVDGNLDNIRGYIAGNSIQYHMKNAHFVENHDEPRAVAEFGSNARANAAAAVSMSLPGMRFYFMGQKEGLHNKLDVHLRRSASEPVITWTQDFYRALITALSQPVFHEGQWSYQNVQAGYDNPVTSWRLVAWKWTLQQQKVLCVINYSDTLGQGRVVLPDASPYNGNNTIPLTDILTGTVYERNISDLQGQGLYIILQPWQAQFFSYV